MTGTVIILHPDKCKVGVVQQLEWSYLFFSKIQRLMFKSGESGESGKSGEKKR
jgi:hypothetical protein